MAANATTWVGRTLVGNDGSRLGTIEEVIADEESGNPQWLAVRSLRGGSEVRLVPARGTTERGVKDLITWLDQEDLAQAPDRVPVVPVDEPPVDEYEADEAEIDEPPMEEEAPEVAAPVAAAPTPPARGRRKAGTNLTQIEGLGPDDATVLVAAGVRTIDALLADAGSPGGRRALAKQTGIDSRTILEWVNRADLMRIHGVGAEFSDLLETAGVDSVRELARRKPANLQRRMEDINDQDQLVRRAPSLSEVERWVQEAKSLPVAVTH